jgi:hypothetical protein
VLTTKTFWNKQFESIGDWSSWLARGGMEDELSIIRRNIDKGLPCGLDRFIKQLEKQIGRVLEYRPLGRPLGQGRIKDTTKEQTRSIDFFYKTR